MAFQGRLLRRLPARVLIDRTPGPSLPRSHVRQLQTLSLSSLAAAPPAPRATVSSAGIWNHSPYGIITRRTLAVKAADAVDGNTSKEGDVQVSEEAAALDAIFDEPPPPPPSEEPEEPEVNVLANLPAGFTPGTAVATLEKKGEKKGGKVTLAEFRDLCNSIQPGRKRHASILRSVLKEYKVSRKLVLDKEEASLAMEVMMRAHLPVEDVSGMDKIKAALVVAETFLEPSTGLYYAAPMPAIDAMLTMLLEGVVEEKLPLVAAEEEEEEEVEEDEEDKADDATYLALGIEPPPRGRKRELRNKYRKLRIMGAPSASKPKKWGEKSPEQLSARVAYVVLRLMDLLNVRKTRPYKNMKKKSAAKYLKQIRINHGPTPGTVHNATQIMLQIRGEALESIVNPCMANRVPIKPETTIMIENHASEQHQEEAEEDSTGDEVESEDAPDSNGDSETKKE